MKVPYHFLPDLAREVAASLESSTPQPNIQGRAIYADSTVKVLLLPFRAGQVLNEHVTPHAAIMHVLTGKGEITLGPDKRSVQAGSWMWMEGSLPHSIRAETDLVLLLQVFLDGRSSRQPAAASAS